MQQETNVSEDPEHGASKIHTTKSGGGGAGKWLLGGLAAVVLAGGGYYAYTHLPSAQSDTQVAYNDTYSDEEPLRAGPLPPSDDVTAESASVEPDAAPAPRREARRTAPARRETASAETVPEETIGITPVELASTDSTDSEEIIVRAPTRPVWAQVPSQRRLSALYPTRALDRGREGEASLHCTVLDGGALDCAPVSATPGGFEHAALRVSRNFRHAATTRDGRDATGTPLNLRVVFRIADEDTRRG
jgi:TonB family protein